MKTYIGLDNGVTGTIAFVNDINAIIFNVPTRRELSYTKAKQYITRIDTMKLYDLINQNVDDLSKCIAVIERPMINPQRFKQSISAARALEAVLIIIEMLNLPYIYIDSKDWQKEMLPINLEKNELKRASLTIGNRLFPHLSEFKHIDRDSLLIAEYARRKKL